MNKGQLKNLTPKSFLHCILTLYTWLCPIYYNSTCRNTFLWFNKYWLVIWTYNLLYIVRHSGEWSGTLFHNDIRTSVNQNWAGQTSFIVLPLLYVNLIWLLSQIYGRFLTLKKKMGKQIRVHGKILILQWSSGYCQGLE